MDERFLGKQATAVLLFVLLLAAGLILSGCVVQVPVDVQATAQALAHSWATQTAEAQPAAGQPTFTPTNTAVPSATSTTSAETPAPTRTATPTQVATATSTFLPAPSATPTATHTSTPEATATPTQGVTPRPTATRTSTPSPYPSCSESVDATLALGWEYAKLGCPKAPAAIVWSARQPFEHGEMIWLQDSDWTYGLDYLDGTDPQKGSWTTGGRGWRWDGSFENGHGLTPPPGLVEPIRGFGFVWFNYFGGPSSALGWGKDQEKGYCALVQRFDKGMLIQSSPAPGCAGGQFNWAANPDFSPIFLALYDDGSWKRF
jgi:hypothetical protein